MSDLEVRRVISQDYTTRFRVLNENGEWVICDPINPDKQSWMQNEFFDMDQFDPAQLNLLILHSGMSY